MNEKKKLRILGEKLSVLERIELKIDLNNAAEKAKTAPLAFMFMAALFVSIAFGDVFVMLFSTVGLTLIIMLEYILYMVWSREIIENWFKRIEE